MAEIGSYIEGKYKILTEIGKGGMSTVYLAMDKNLNKQWAVKEVRKRASDRNNNSVENTAIVEANLMKRLDHPLLPRIVDIIDNPDVIYVIMDYIEGESLNKVLEREGAQPQDLVIKWAKDLCSVLEYLHNQTPPIIYRDMKPNNIMLQPNGSIKLIDFGIAREYKENNTSDTTSLGTRGYAAPEQFGGHGQTDARTDIYGLGITLYHLVTGQDPQKPPYEIYPIRQWNPALSAGLEKIITKCTQLNPNDRYQNCAELQYALDHYEETDEAHLQLLKKKVRRFYLFSGLAAGFIGAGILFQALKMNKNNQDYSLAIQRAETAADEESKISYYENAINIKPADTEPYYGLVDTFKTDADFTVDEEKKFNKAINTNLENLKKNSDYPNLSFEIGKLYWYYYSYGKDTNTDNDVTRMKSAITWFDDVVNIGGKENKNYSVAKIYSDIGAFNRDVTLNVNEASDKGTYAPYYQELNSLYETLQSEDNEIVKLEGYKLCVSALETYSRKFMQDGIEEQDMESFLEKLINGVTKVDTSTDKSSDIKSSIIARESSVKQAISNAFIPVKESADDSEGN